MGVTEFTENKAGQWRAFLKKNGIQTEGATIGRAGALTAVSLTACPSRYRQDKVQHVLARAGRGKTNTHCMKQRVETQQPDKIAQHTSFYSLLLE